MIANSGHLRVTVAPTGATVEFVRSYLAGLGKNGNVAASYTNKVTARRPHLRQPMGVEHADAPAIALWMMRTRGSPCRVFTAPSS